MNHYNFGMLETVRMTSNKPILVIFNDPYLIKAFKKYDGNPRMFKPLLDHYQGKRGIHPRSYFVPGSTIRIYGEN